MRQILLDSVDSTNEYLKRLSSLSPEPFLLVSTLTQSHGKGRMGRSWKDEKNKSFLGSFLIPYTEKSFQVGFLAASAAANLIKIKYDLSAKIKWPNDIYLDGKKLGGILSEKSRDYLITGIGINLNQREFPAELKEIAISLYLKKKFEIDAAEWRNDYSECFFSFYQEWEGNRPLFLKNRVEPILEWVGKKIEVVHLDGTSIEGIYEGIDENGFLVLKTHAGSHKITTGDLKLWLRE